ncbi:aldo/keto reductase [Alkalicoccus chagannorensis]|uniref:aldo/keto reductase n=1 Tax=Alkalicoccus chagannorensis TaxID=427072 RepID=UPI00047C341C|nr:aldo/keto reductase [Alkalicoccus chagannorensis]
MKHLQDTVKLHNGTEMPWVGLGVYKVDEATEVEQAVETALETGYRSIDTASFYDNEAGVGRAVKRSGVPEDEIFITTKVWNDQQGYEETLRAFEASREKLGMDIDLYLIHWPVKETYRDTWRALEKLYARGDVRAVGVSNFEPHHLQELRQVSDLVPMVNQVEYHPWLAQKELLEYCRTNGIQLEAWSPLTRGRKLDDPIVGRIAGRHGKTPAQVILRWDLQQEVVTIPKSVTPARIRENADIFDFELSAEEQRELNALDAGIRFGKHPDEFA